MGVVVLHNRQKFYNKKIYWYEFLQWQKIPRKFLKVPSTPYYEFGGTHQEALKELKRNEFEIIEGSEI